MFRFEIGARVLVRRYDWKGENQTEVKILDKVPGMIKAKVLSNEFFQIGAIRWLSDQEWFVLTRVGKRG